MWLTPSGDYLGFSNLRARHSCPRRFAFSGRDAGREWRLCIGQRRAEGGCSSLGARGSRDGRASEAPDRGGSRRYSPRHVLGGRVRGGPREGRGALTNGSHVVRIGALAVEDLQALHAYIAAESGPRIASDYLDRIEAACRSLETFPARGRGRDDLAAGLRTLSFEGRVLIGYRIDGDVVTIERVLYGGRDVDAVF